MEKNTYLPTWNNLALKIWFAFFFLAKDCRHVTHILEDLPSCKPGIDHLLELLPRLQPRFYSISSSSKVHKDAVHVTAVVIEYETPTGKEFCTTFCFAFTLSLLAMSPLL